MSTKKLSQFIVYDTGYIALYLMGKFIGIFLIGNRVGSSNLEPKNLMAAF